MHVDVFLLGDMQLHRHSIRLEEPPFDEFHFSPGGRALFAVAAHRDMVPTTAGRSEDMSESFDLLGIRKAPLRASP